MEFHARDLCRSAKDTQFVRSIEGERILVRTDFAGLPQGKGINQVWKHYARPVYNDAVFAKLDDDDVFLETESFPSFIQSAVDNPHHVISSLTINNGASTKLIPDLWDGLHNLRIGLLDAHRSAEYADMCHRWFFQNWQTLTGQAPNLVPTEDWVSINSVAMSWKMLRRITDLLGTPSPAHISGRDFKPRNRVGDEGAANMHPRLIHTGHVCAHLTFGPQDALMSPPMLTEYRKLYQDVANQYL
jgi:hypothetical protein